MKKIFLLLFMVSLIFGRKFQTPPIIIKVYGDGKPIMNAMVFGRLYTPGYDKCSSNMNNFGKTNSSGIIKISHDKKSSFYLKLKKQARCKGNGFKSVLNSPNYGTGETGVKLKVSASGYKTANVDQVFYGSKNDMWGYLYDPLEVIVMLDKN